MLNSDVAGRYIFSVRNGDIDINEVPEPSSLELFGPGTVTALVARRRRQ